MEENPQKPESPPDIKPSTSSQIKSENTESDDSDDDVDSQGNAITENVSENYEEELDVNLSTTIKDQKQKLYKIRAIRKRSKIPTHLKGLMGEANLRFARGEYEIAQKMCFELIRQAPMAYEPYWTLSQLYENDPIKSVQYLTIAAHLNPMDATNWLRLAQIHVDGNNLRKAVTCYTRAINADPSVIEHHLKRLELLEKLDDTNYIRKCRTKLIHLLPPNEYEMLFKMAKDLAEQYHELEEYEKAAEVIAVAFEKCPKEITPEMVNIYLELLLLLRNYVKCLDIFVQYCNIEVEIILDDSNQISILSFNMPDNIPIDLRIKFIICTIRLEAFDLLDRLLEPLLLEENVENIGDLYLDVAENLMTARRPEDALKLLIPLIKSDNYSLAAVWLKYAECLQACNMIEPAIDSYKTVVKMAPQHTDARFPLSDLLLEQNRYQEALDVLHQDYTSNELDVGLLIKKMELQKRIGDFDNYIKSAEILLLRHCIEIKAYSEIKIISFLDRSEKISRLKKVRSLRGETYTPSNIVSIREPPVHEEYRLFKETLQMCFDRKEYALLQKFVFTALSSSKLNKIYQKELIVLALFSCIYNNDSEHGYYIVRDFIMKTPPPIPHILWNLWNLMLQNFGEVKHARFIVRQSKLIGKTEAKLLAANNALCAGSYKIAIMSLTPLLKEHPTPFLTFLIGVFFLQLSQQKIGIRKKYITPIVYSLFLHYSKNRSKDALQEINYNLGRMYHKYGVMHIAAYYYNLVLEFQHPLIDKYPNMSLRKEAAFNLFLIYKESGNHIGCKNILHKYLTV
ncbi:transcription initiation factor iiic tfiiic polypeptide 3-related [Holotrichia oblita]|uniref:Transcription initiation factor iiic tfiiic polypeptide 3-related n=2 Tax=Holotrichia oblita TaxID=644536 RepID=A0ACB9SPW6_HOLOL|nr:transcription initiation factor iiic tfiiic polypeptide 3-related [Holotrichia oblita]